MADLVPPRGRAVFVASLAGRATTAAPRAARDQQARAGPPTVEIGQAQEPRARARGNADLATEHGRNRQAAKTLGKEHFRHLASV